MNTKHIYSIFLLILGEALVIFSFLHFGQNLETNIISLNIIISSIIYGLLFVDTIMPWIDLKDKSQKSIGSIGLLGFFTFFYMLFALCTMVYCNSLNPIPFTSQLIIQGALLFFLFLGFLLTFNSSENVREVYMEESNNRERIDEMKKATKAVQLKLDQLKDIPNDVISNINSLQANLRFLSPCNSQDAILLENKFIDEMKTAYNCIFDIPFNFEKMNEIIQNCERTFQERKQAISN